jgi:hypothetical protein
MMTNGKRFDRLSSCPSLRHYATIRMERLRKITKNLNHHSRDRDLNMVRSEYELGVLTISPRRSVTILWECNIL